MMAPLTDNQLKTFADKISSELLFNREPDMHFYKSFGDFECEAHYDADFHEEYSDISGPYHWYSNEKLEVIGVWGINNEYPDDVLEDMKRKLNLILN